MLKETEPLNDNWMHALCKKNKALQEKSKLNYKTPKLLKISLTKEQNLNTIHGIYDLFK